MVRHPVVVVVVWAVVWAVVWVVWVVWVVVVVARRSPTPCLRCDDDLTIYWQYMKLARRLASPRTSL